MPISRLQMILIALGAACVAGALLWVPYRAVLMRDGDNLTRFVGYAPVFAPPQAAACGQAFPRVHPVRLLTVCTVHAQPVPALMTAGAIGAFTLTLVLLAGLLPGRPLRTLGGGAGAARPVDSPADRLRRARPELALGGGAATEESPLVVTEVRDYVAVEYAAAHAMLDQEGLDYRLKLQGVRERAGATVDVLTFDTKPIGAPAWTGQRIFYFDVTAGTSRRL